RRVLVCVLVAPEGALLATGVEELPARGLVAPGVLALARAARRELPLCLGGEAPAALLAVVVGHRPGHAVDGVLASVRLARVAKGAVPLLDLRGHPRPAHLLQGALALALLHAGAVSAGGDLGPVE